ncbi:MAG: nitroreductase [Micrococcales bacterium 73-13]|nr:MAG: nitroreductase [Micrococcales bacterium 73-13]
MPLEGEYGPSTSDWARAQAEAYEASGGREATTLADTGMPVVVLTTVGAKSGLLRKTALMRVEDHGRYAVVASRGGAPEHPQWYWNLLANPHVELQDGPVRRDYQARQLDGVERDEWWARAVAAYPPYADYQERTDRVIPVLLLEPIEG